jgi:hypothetical protein
MSTVVVEKEVWLAATWQTIVGFQKDFVVKGEKRWVGGNQYEIIPSQWQMHNDLV